MPILCTIESELSFAELTTDPGLLVAEITSVCKAPTVEDYLVLAAIMGGIVRTGRQSENYWSTSNGDVYLEPTVDDRGLYTKIDFSITKAAIEQIPYGLRQQFDQNSAQTWDET